MRPTEARDVTRLSHLDLIIDHQQTTVSGLRVQLHHQRERRSCGMPTSPWLFFYFVLFFCCYFCYNCCSRPLLSTSTPLPSSFFSITIGVIVYPIFFLLLLLIIQLWPISVVKKINLPSVPQHCKVFGAKRPKLYPRKRRKTDNLSERRSRASTAQSQQGKGGGK